MNKKLGNSQGLHARTVSPSRWVEWKTYRPYGYRLVYSGYRNATQENNYCYYKQSFSSVNSYEIKVASAHTVGQDGTKIRNAKVRITTSSGNSFVPKRLGTVRIDKNIVKVEKGDVLTFSFFEESAGRYFRCGSSINTTGINYYKMKQPTLNTYLYFDRNASGASSGGAEMLQGEKPNQDRGCGNNGHVEVTYLQEI